jgi:deoxyribodipyrimidine photo-lyase
MIVGSLLVKHLLQHWLEGARWFWDTLVDADLANNTMGWQWIGGCGADAAPYFRIFNPITQGEKFDPDGSYVKQYLPELSKVPAKYVHKPWELGGLDLATAGLRLGSDYPVPVIEHSVGRARALKAFDALKAARA